MKQILLVFSATMIMLSSCTSVKFESAQPKDKEELKEFPDNVLGIYIDTERDTLILTSNSFQYGNKKSSIFRVDGTLTSGESILKRDNDYYVLSLKDENGWEVITFKYSGKDLTVYYIDLGKDREKTIKKLKGILAVKEVKDSEGKVDYYLINPSGKEFETLMAKNIFSRVTTFTRVK